MKTNLHESVFNGDGFDVLGGLVRQFAGQRDLVVLVLLVAEIVQVDAGLVLILVLVLKINCRSLLKKSLEHLSSFKKDHRGKLGLNL